MLLRYNAAIMIAFLLPLLSVYSFATGLKPPAECWRFGGREQVRVLFVGNSQTAFWDLGKILEVIAASGPARCPRVVADRSVTVRGGANLSSLAADARERIRSGEYDAVVLQESIDLVDCSWSRPENFRLCGRYTMAFPTAYDVTVRSLINLARAHNVAPVILATGYPETLDREAHFSQMLLPQLAVARELGVPVAAAGLGWLKAWEQNPNLDLYDTDRAHPGFRGAYLTALTLYHALIGPSPVGLTADIQYAPDSSWTWACNQERPCWSLPAEEALLLQQAAVQAQDSVRRGSL